MPIGLARERTDGQAPLESRRSSPPREGAARAPHAGPQPRPPHSLGGASGQSPCRVAPVGNHAEQLVVHRVVESQVVGDLMRRQEQVTGQHAAQRPGEEHQLPHRPRGGEGGGVDLEAHDEGDGVFGAPAVAEELADLGVRSQDGVPALHVRLVGVAPHEVGVRRAGRRARRRRLACSGGGGGSSRRTLAHCGAAPRGCRYSFLPIPGGCATAGCQPGARGRAPGACAGAWERMGTRIC